MNIKVFDKILKSKYFGVCSIAIAIVAALIIFLTNSQETKLEKINQDFDEFEYTAALENKINNIVSKIYGAGRSECMVTIENTYEKFYAKEISENKANAKDLSSSSIISGSNNYSENYVLIQESDGESALEITEYTPKITGVVIVCEGADQTKIRESITSAVSVLLGIDQENVCVLKSK